MNQTKESFFDIGNFKKEARRAFEIDGEVGKISEVAMAFSLDKICFKFLNENARERVAVYNTWVLLNVGANGILSDVGLTKEDVISEPRLRYILCSRHTSATENVEGLDSSYLTLILKPETVSVSKLTKYDRVLMNCDYWSPKEKLFFPYKAKDQPYDLKRFEELSDLLEKKALKVEG